MFYILVLCGVNMLATVANLFNFLDLLYPFSNHVNNVDFFFPFFEKANKMDLGMRNE